MAARRYISHKSQPHVDFVIIGSTAIAPESQVTVDLWAGFQSRFAGKTPGIVESAGRTCALHLTIYGRPNAESELPAAIAMYSFPSTGYR
jgi:hypothetical protein